MLTSESIVFDSLHGGSHRQGAHGGCEERRVAKTVRRELTGRAVRVQTLILSRMLAPSVRL